jgi:hypothetical protein
MIDVGCNAKALSASTSATPPSRSRSTRYGHLIEGHARSTPI